MRLSRRKDEWGSGNTQVASACGRAAGKSRSWRAAVSRAQLFILGAGCRKGSLGRLLPPLHLPVPSGKGERALCPASLLAEETGEKMLRKLERVLEGENFFRCYLVAGQGNPALDHNSEPPLPSSSWFGQMPERDNQRDNQQKGGSERQTRERERQTDRHRQRASAHTVTALSGKIPMLYMKTGKGKEAF